MVTHREDGFLSNFFDWQGLTDGIFGLGTATMNRFTNTFLESYQVNAYGFLLSGSDPHIELNELNGSTSPPPPS